MDKPTIFFSHSSKDRDLILPIRNKIVDITGGTMDIFMSSDGQSIPLGRNWVSKIEEGLKNAQIMFIFVTPNSIKSDWIYFEAGYAYSKDIEVIPVGIGIHIGELKAPLNLLQGFDVLSCDSLDNFISVINKKFSLSFKQSFDESDYASIHRFIFDEETDFNFSEVFSSGTWECYSQDYRNSKMTDIIRYDVEEFYNLINRYLDENTIKYSSSNNYKLLVSGIKIEVIGKEIEPVGYLINKDHKIMFRFSTYNFKESFEVLVKLFEVIGLDLIVLQMELHNEYDCIYREEQLSSIISLSDDLDYSQDTIDIFKYKNKISWWVEIEKELISKKRFLSFSFDRNYVDINDVMDLMNCLHNVGIIYKKK